MPSSRVEMPNVIGMSQLCRWRIAGIQTLCGKWRLSRACQTIAKTAATMCAQEDGGGTFVFFNSLYWDFLIGTKRSLTATAVWPSLSATWGRMKDEQRRIIKMPRASLCA